MGDLRVTEQFIEGLARCRRVKRYALESTLQIQNVADHSYGAAMMAWYIVCWMECEGLPLSEGFTADRAATCMLFHDYPEHLTGDLNYFVKKHSGNDFLACWDKMEEQRLMQWFSPDVVEESMTQSLMRDCIEENVYPVISADEKTILKIADYTEFLLYCVEELRMGNSYAANMISAGTDIILELAAARCGFLLREDSPVSIVLDRADKEVREYEKRRA